MTIIGIPFPSGKKALCLWDFEPQEQNLRFLETIQPDYYRYLASTHIQALEGDQAMMAAIALRTAYHQGLETLFTFLCGALQAPHCIVAWIPKCNTGQLRELVEAISQIKDIKTPSGTKQFSWLTLSREIFKYTK